MERIDEDEIQAAMIEKGIVLAYSRYVVLVILCMLSACTVRENDRTEDGRVIVTYWEKWTGFEADAMQEVVDDFNASQNRIEVQMLPVSGILDKLMLATAGGNPPDVAGIWTHSITEFSEKSALTPLDGFLENSSVKEEDYIPVYWELCRNHGFLWALPSTPASLALHWNKRLFRKAGLDPERPPRSLRELDEMSDKLTIVSIERDGERQKMCYTELTPEEKADHGFSILQVGHIPTVPGWYSEMWGFWFGGKLWDGGSNITANSQKNIEAYTWYQSYADKLGVDNLRTFGQSFGNFASPQSPFLAGKVAMVLQGVWLYNFIDKFAPGMEWGVAPFPSQDPERLPNVCIVESDVLVIPRGARHVREAFEFIEYVNSQPAIEKLNLGQRKFSPLVTVSDEFTTRHPNPYISVFMDLAMSSNACHVPKVTVWQEYKDEMGVSASRLDAKLTTPVESLAEVQDRVQWKFNRILRRWNKVKKERIREWGSYDPE